MSVDTLLNQVAFKLGSEIQDEEIVCKIADFKIRQDRHGRKILVVELLCSKHGRVVVAYSPSYARVFGENLKKLGVEKISDMLTFCYKFKKMKLPKAREDYTDPYPRFIPVDVVACPDDLIQS